MFHKLYLMSPGMQTLIEGCVATGELQSCSVLADLEATKKREEKLKDIAASITTTSSKRRPYPHTVVPLRKVSTPTHPSWVRRVT